MDNKMIKVNLKNMAQWNYFIVFLLLFTFSQKANCQFTDDFSDGDFTNNPSWIGQDSFFIVNSLQQLQLNAPAVTAKSYLSTLSSTMDSTQWEFYVELNFNPSSTNRARVYLSADTSNLNASNVNGYFVMIGNTQDEISLYRSVNGSITKIIDGLDGVVNVSRPTVRIKVLRDHLGNWSLFRDANGGNNYVLEGSVFDNTFTTSVYFGVLCEYTSTRSTSFFYDDFYVGTQIPDTIPPALLSFELFGNDSIRLNYNEKLNSSIALDGSNYFLNNGIGIPQNIQFANADSSAIWLQFSQSFQAQSHHTLQIGNQEDLIGNSLGFHSINFFYFIPDSIQKKEVRINEIMAGPTPQVGLPNAEWIELYNTSAKTFSTKDWKLRDASSTVGVFPEARIDPGEYVIVCRNSDTTALNPFGKTIGLASMPILNKSGDDLGIYDQNDNEIDFLVYSDSWYQDNSKKAGGWTLELKNPFDPCAIGSNNWSASNDPSGGTPGRENSIFNISPDTISPKVAYANILSSNYLEFGFDELLDSNSALISNFQIDGGLFVSDLLPTGQANVFEILLSGSMNVGQVYSLSIKNFRDCAGNVMRDTILEIGVGATPERYDLIITEIHAIPNDISALPNEEFIEIYNRTNNLIDLSGLLIVDPGATGTISTGLLKGGEYAIICSSSNLNIFQSFGKTIGVSTFPTLNNTSDIISIRNADNTTIHSVSYSDTWYKTVEDKSLGLSLEMIDPENFCGEAENWSSSIDPSGGSPGKENSIFAANPDLDAPKIDLVEVLDNRNLNIYFNEILDTLLLGNAVFNSNPDLGISSILKINERVLGVSLAVDMPMNQLYEMQASGIIDCIGNVMNNEEVKFVLPDTASVGNIILNEILFNSKGSTQSEFVELYNNTNDRYFNLVDYQIGNYNLSLDTIGTLRDITERQSILYPNEYVFISRNVAEVRSFYPSAATKFGIEANIPAMTNSSGSVILFKKKENIVLDRFDYEEDFHFPVLRDVKGVSLERIDYDLDGNRPDNWQSAAENAGFATPGAKNSQNKRSFISEDLFAIEPKIFSPDNDGFDDVSIFSYNLDASGYAANITIYSQQGAIVSQLVRNQLVGTEGNYIWDGVNDRGEKVPVGIYIVFFEFFAPDGDVIREKKTCVVATRL